MAELGEARPRVAAGLEVDAVSDGYVVHDSRRDRIHYLNQTAAVVLELCNGTFAEKDMPLFLQRAFDLSEAPVSDVVTCLASLRHEGLIE